MHRLVPALGAVLTAAALIVTGCSQQIPQAPAETQAPSTTAPRPEGSTVPRPTPVDIPAVPGFAAGEMPPVPLFVLPDLSLLTGSASAFTIDVNEAFADLPGVTVTAAECDAQGVVVSGSGNAYLYGDGSGTYVGPDGVIRNFGDGSGTRVGDGVVIENNGDGSGTFVGNDVVIENFGDGSGKYVGNGIVVEIDGKGAGKHVGEGVVIDNAGDGSGKYVGEGMVIENNGDGSGSFTGHGFVIKNNGDGTGRANGADVEVDPLPPVPRLGAFPPVDALAPLESCGTVITFDTAVLFDFNRSEVRADAAATLRTVASVFDSAEIPRATISGHTDAIGSDADNQQLSEERAEAVVSALSAEGVTATLTAEGHGESRPVAANEIDGIDNPAGRQLNRRVEIFIPAS